MFVVCSFVHFQRPVEPLNRPQPAAVWATVIAEAGRAHCCGYIAERRTLSVERSAGSDSVRPVDRDRQTDERTTDRTTTTTTTTQINHVNADSNVSIMNGNVTEAPRRRRAPAPSHCRRPAPGSPLPARPPGRPALISRGGRANFSPSSPHPPGPSPRQPTAAFVKVPPALPPPLLPPHTTDARRRDGGGGGGGRGVYIRAQRATHVRQTGITRRRDDVLQQQQQQQQPDNDNQVTPAAAITTDAKQYIS